jgi:hypothetical protein
LTQKQASLAAGISRGASMLIEAGSFERVRYGDIRAYAKALVPGSMVSSGGRVLISTEC